MKWLNQTTKPDAVEWSGFNSELRQNIDMTRKPKTMYMFGSAVHNILSHPDTILTTVDCICDTLKCFGSTWINME